MSCRPQGVPLRVELGPREVKLGQLVLVRRDTGEKSTVTSDGACQTITDMLEKIQSSMFEKYAICCVNIIRLFLNIRIMCRLCAKIATTEFFKLPQQNGH